MSRTTDIQCKNIDGQICRNCPCLLVLTDIDLRGNKVKQHGFKSTVCNALNNRHCEKDPRIPSLDMVSTLHSQHRRRGKGQYVWRSHGSGVSVDRRQQQNCYHLCGPCRDSYIREKRIICLPPVLCGEPNTGTATLLHAQFDLAPPPVQAHFLVTVIDIESPLSNHCQVFANLSRRKGGQAAQARVPAFGK